MNQVVMGYLGAALLLTVGGVAFALIVRGASPLVVRAPETWHRWGWLLLAVALALPAAWRTATHTRRGPAPIELWSGAATWDGGPRLPRLTVRWAGSDAGEASRIQLDRWPMAAGISFLLGGVAISALSLVRRRRRLAALCAALPVIKRVGAVRVCASALAPVPFAARAGGLAYIVVPTALVADGVRLRLVIGHEAHHHRRGDLVGAVWLGIVRALFFWNPAVALWEKALIELQDLACDRRVVDRQRVSAVEYGRCLLWAAQAGRGPRYRLAPARGMADSVGSLRRRITALAGGGSRRQTGAVAAGAVLLLGMVGTSWLVQGAVTDRRVSEGEVLAMAARIEKRSGFQLVVDGHVVDALNRRVASPEAREPMRQAFARMATYRAMIEQVLRERNLPLELLSVPLHESGFDNDAHPDRPVAVRSAGIWQIIPVTARKLGLEVSPARDERLDPKRATEAATAYLADNHARLGDWPLAIAAYNGGLGAVEATTAGLSTAQARARILASAREYGRYLASAMASIILIDNPSLLD
jgi:hypothetical protein